jgi:hypothetical protein
MSYSDSGQIRMTVIIKTGTMDKAKTKMANSVQKVQPFNNFFFSMSNLFHAKNSNFFCTASLSRIVLRCFKN